MTTFQVGLFIWMGLVLILALIQSKINMLQNKINEAQNIANKAAADMFELIIKNQENK